MLHDVAGRIEQAAGGIEFDEDGAGVGICRVREAALDVAGADGLDGVAHCQLEDDRIGLGACAHGCGEEEGDRGEGEQAELHGSFCPRDSRARRMPRAAESLGESLSALLT